MKELKLGEVRLLSSVCCSCLLLNLLDSPTGIQNSLGSSSSFFLGVCVSSLLLPFSQSLSFQGPSPFMTRSLPPWQDTTKGSINVYLIFIFCIGSVIPILELRKQRSKRIEEKSVCTGSEWQNGNSKLCPLMNTSAVLSKHLQSHQWPFIHPWSFVWGCI